MSRGIVVNGRGLNAGGRGLQRVPLIIHDFNDPELQNIDDVYRYEDDVDWEITESHSNHTDPIFTETYLRQIDQNSNGPDDTLAPAHGHAWNREGDSETVDFPYYPQPGDRIRWYMSHDDWDPHGTICISYQDDENCIFVGFRPPDDGEVQLHYLEPDVRQIRRDVDGPTNTNVHPDWVECEITWHKSSRMTGRMWEVDQDTGERVEQYHPDDEGWEYFDSSSSAASTHYDNAFGAMAMNDSDRIAIHYARIMERGIE